MKTPTSLRGLASLAALGLFVATLAAGVSPPEQANAAFGNGYTYQRSITIDFTKMSGGSNLSSFPVLISGTYSYLATTANGGKVTNANGYDIIFTSDAAGSTKLDHEIESYNAVSGAINMWVRIPTLSASANTVIYLFYGNSSISTSQQNVTAVWDSNYKGVWHLEETAIDEQLTATHTDSTSNANNATQGGNDSVTGKIANAQNFDNVNDYIIRPSNASLQPTNAITLSGWINLRTFGSGNEIDPILRKGPVSANNYQLALHDGKPSLYINGSDDTPTVGSATVLSANTWYYVAATYNRVTGIVYLNGASSASSNFTYAIATDTRDLFIGGRNDGLDLSDGWLDEVRISNSARTAGWIQTEYNNQSSPATFYSVGSEQTSGGTAALTGTITTAMESNIVAGGSTIILTLTGDTWVAAGATFDAQRQAIINGIDSAQSESTGWDAVVVAGLPVSAVVRTSNSVVTITLPAFAAYNISATETVTATIPAAALTSATTTVATPTFTISGTRSASIADLTLTAVDYSHSPQARTGTMTLTADDSSGSNAGWNVTILSSAFVYSGGNGGSNIAAANFSLTSAATPVMTFGQAVDATNGPKVPAASPVGTLDVTRKTVQANASYGRGTYTQALGVSLSVPAMSRAGTYTGTLTTTISAGP